MERLVQALCPQCGRINTVTGPSATCHWCYAELPHAQNGAGARRAVVARPPQEWPLPDQCRRCAGPLPPRAFDCPRCGFSALVDLPVASKSGRRGPWTWLGALVVLAVLAAPIAIVLRPRTGSQASPIPQTQSSGQSVADWGLGSTASRPLTPGSAGAATMSDNAIAVPLSSTPIPATERVYASPAVLRFLGGAGGADWATELGSWLCEPPDSLVALPQESPASAPVKPDLVGPLRSLAYPDERAVDGESGARGHGGPGASYRANSHTIYVHAPNDAVIAYYQRLLGDHARQTAWVTERFVPVHQLVRLGDREATVVTVCPSAAFASSEPLTAVRLCRVERGPGVANTNGASTSRGPVREVGR